MPQKRRGAWYWTITGSLLAEFENSPQRSVRKRFWWDAWYVSCQITNTIWVPGGFQDNSCFKAVSCVCKCKYIILLSYCPPALARNWAEKPYALRAWNVTTPGTFDPNMAGIVLKNNYSGENSNLRWPLEQVRRMQFLKIAGKREGPGEKGRNLTVLLLTLRPYPHSATPEAERALLQLFS